MKPCNRYAFEPRHTKVWLRSCDFCRYQEDGGHYCLLYSRQVKNMDITHCWEWWNREGSEYGRQPVVKENNEI